MERESTAARLNQIMAERKMKQVDILEACKPYCKKYGIKLAKSDLSQYVSGKVQPGQDKLSILSMALKVSEVWLMGYDIGDTKGNKTEYYHNEDAAQIAQEVFDNPELRLLFDAARDVSADDLRLVVNMVKRLKRED